MDVEWLMSDTGAAAIALAERTLAADGDRAAVTLARHLPDPVQRTEALTQAQLRTDGLAKFGADASSLLLTRDGLEQASRPVVAERRARIFADLGVTTIVDLCCGIGSDAFALARIGINVIAVDADPTTAALVNANTAALGITDQMRVVCGDALAVPIPDGAAVFADPARRAGGRRIFDPRDYSPPLDSLWAVSTDRVTAVKVAPGIAHDAIPDDARAEWVSVDGDVVEAALWRADDRPARTAAVLSGGHVNELTGDGTRDADVDEIGDYVYEPDGAVIRARLVAELGDLIGARLAHPSIAYMYRGSPIATPFARGWRVREVFPFHVKRLREALRERGIGRLTIKKRGADIVPDKLRRELKLSGDSAATLIVTRDRARHVALLCDAEPEGH